MASIDLTTIHEPETQHDVDMLELEDLTTDAQVSVEPAKRGALLIRKTTKQSWSQASTMDTKDSVEALTKWVEAMNDELGWKKYDVKERD